MQTIALINQKGGAGKSTIAINLAVAAAAEGRNVAAIDLDSNATFMKWHDRRDADLPAAVSAHASRLPQQMKAMEDAGCDLLLLDTVGRADADSIATAQAADLVIVPTEPTQVEMEQAISTFRLLKSLGTPFFAVFTKVPPSGTEAEEALEWLRDEHSVAVCPAGLVYRKAFKNSIADGKAAVEWDDSKAKAEVWAVYKFVCDQVDKITSNQDIEMTEETPHAQA